MSYHPLKPICTLAIVFVSTLGIAIPSGLTPVPKIVYPKLGDRTVPAVVVNSDLNDAKVLYVKPTEGIFVSQGVVKSPVTRCDLVKEELKISEINVKARNSVVQAMREAQANHQRNQETLNKYIRAYEALATQVEPIKAIVNEALADKKEALDEVKRIQDAASEIRDQLAVTKDAEKVAKLEALIVALDAEQDSANQVFLKASKDARNTKKQLSALELELAEALGKRNAYQKTTSIQLDELTQIQKRMDDLQEASDKVLKKYSERVGGYTTVTSDFAPSEYLEVLNKANPQYSFQYIPTVTASVDASIPGKVRPDSSLAHSSLPMILDAKWSDPRNVRNSKKLERMLFPNNEKIQDPITESQVRIAQLESSLVGTKFLSLELSVLGYCALKEPESLASEFTGGAEETFKLALYYTYPVNYQIKLSGRYNQYDALYEFNKITKSSSWFGLSKEQKQEKVQHISHGKAFDIKIQPIGAELTMQDSLLLAEKIKEQLWYFSAERYLDKGIVSSLKPENLNKPGDGLSKIGERLMQVPNPFCLWGGLVLSTLGDMFGSASDTTIEDISKSSWIDLNYEAGFTALQSGDLTIGDLKRAKIVEDRH